MFTQELLNKLELLQTNINEINITLHELQIMSDNPTEYESQTTKQPTPTPVQPTTMDSSDPLVDSSNLERLFTDERFKSVIEKIIGKYIDNNINSYIESWPEFTKEPHQYFEKIIQNHIETNNTLTEMIQDEVINQIGNLRVTTN